MGSSHAFANENYKFSAKNGKFFLQSSAFHLLIAGTFDENHHLPAKSHNR